MGNLLGLHFSNVSRRRVNGFSRMQVDEMRGGDRGLTVLFGPPTVLG
jgi:hypothetical protein